MDMRSEELAECIRASCGNHTHVHPSASSAEVSWSPMTHSCAAVHRVTTRGQDLQCAPAAERRTWNINRGVRLKGQRPRRKDILVLVVVMVGGGDSIEHPEANRKGYANKQPEGSNYS